MKYDTSELDQIYKPEAKPTKKVPSTASDFVTGIQSHLGAPSVAGLTQSLLNGGMGIAHSMVPSLVGPSPEQTDVALKNAGVTGDVGPTGTGVWTKAEDEEQQREEEAEKRSPNASMAGHVTGDILGFMAGNAALKGLTGGAKLAEVAKDAPWYARAAASGVNEAATLAPVGVAQGALQSKAHLVGGTPEEQAKVVNDAAKSGLENAAIGAVAGAGLSTLGSAGKALMGIGPLKDLAGYYNLGKEGANLSSEASQLGDLSNPQSLMNPVSRHSEQAARSMLDNITQADEHLGQQVGNVVNQATEQGQVIKTNPIMNKKIDQIFELIPEGASEGTEEAGEAAESEQGEQESDFNNKSFKGFFDTANKFKQDGLTPAELQQFRNEMGNYARQIYMRDPYAANQAYQMTNNLTQILKANVPGYGDAAGRLNNFRKAIPETILSKDNPVDVTNLRYSGVRNVDTKLMNNLKTMIRGMYDPSNMNAKASYSNLLQSLQDLNGKELLLKAEGKIPETVFDTIGKQPQDIEAFLKDNAAKSKLIQDAAGGKGFDIMHPIKSTVGQGAAWAANKIGVQAGKSSAASNPVLNAGTKLFNAPDEVLKGLSQKISGLPNGKELSTALDAAIDKNNTMGKNAILFSILQNPNYRNLIESNIMGVIPK